MDSVVTAATGTTDVIGAQAEDRGRRLAELRALRRWRADHSWTMRTLALIVPVVAALAGCLLAMQTTHARVQIDFDPMRPAIVTAPAAPAAPATSGVPVVDAAPAAPALPTLRITRLIGGTGTSASTNVAASGMLSALVDDTWVRRGDVVAGYRVTALRTESVDLVNLVDPAQRLTLRLNPVSVQRVAAQATNPASAAPKASAALPSWPAVALEKKP